MRTTEKELCTKVQNHITDGLSTDETTDRVAQLRQVVEEFGAYWCPYEKRRNPNRQAAFIDFLHGLPATLSIDFYYDAQRKALQEWHEQTEAESAIYSDAAVDSKYCYLIYREFCKMCRAAGIDF